jgi:predicted NUDIX family phosphoesterase
MGKTAHILAVDAAVIAASYPHTAYYPDPSGEVVNKLTEAGLFLGPRPLLENDPRFRQIIPYVLLRGPDGRYVGYVRGGGGGEARLHGKISVGLGGHIDLPDVVQRGDGSVDLATTLDMAADRELREEVDVMRGDVRWTGVLVAYESDVDKVHLGIVGVADYVGEAHSGEADVQTELSVFSAADLSGVSDRLEAWTALLVPHL